MKQKRATVKAHSHRTRRDAAEMSIHTKRDATRRVEFMNACDWLDFL